MCAAPLRTRICTSSGLGPATGSRLFRSSCPPFWTSRGPDSSAQLWSTTYSTITYWALSVTAPSSRRATAHFSVGSTDEAPAPLARPRCADPPPHVSTSVAPRSLSGTFESASAASYLASSMRVKTSNVCASPSPTPGTTNDWRCLSLAIASSESMWLRSMPADAHTSRGVCSQALCHG